MTGTAEGKPAPDEARIGRSTPGRMRDVSTAVGLSAVVLVLMTATLGDYGMAWDEGFTVERVDRLREWFSWVAGDTTASKRAWPPATSNLDPRPGHLGRLGPGSGSPWARETLRFFWPFAREEPNGHPPFYALLGLAGLTATEHLLSPPSCYRIGPAALFALTVGAVYWFMAREYGRLAGAASSLGLLTMPRVFAHAHLASYDVPTLCLWFLGVASFHRASTSKAGGGSWAVAFGVAWGCDSATKLTGWFLPVPLVAWAAFYRDRRAARAFLIGAVVAAATLYVLIPPWWADPIGGVRVFLRSNLGREARSPIPTSFFGTIYPFSLPWYNTLAWTAIVTPPAALAFAAWGIGGVVAGRFRDRAGTLLLGCWATLMVLRALPGAPGHDGDRQFLPAFVFLACLAGVGARSLSGLLHRVASPRLAGGVAISAVAAALAAGAWSTWRTHPLQLSYYNILIGGPAGAYWAGMEPTFYWDALTPDARGWINDHTAPGRSLMVVYPIPTFDYLHHWGLLRPPPLPSRAEPPQWYLVQNRPGILRSYPNCVTAAYLLAHATPRYATTLEGAPGVPLLAVFSIEDAAVAEGEMLRQQAAEVPGAR